MVKTHAIAISQTSIRRHIHLRRIHESSLLVLRSKRLRLSQGNLRILNLMSRLVPSSGLRLHDVTLSRHVVRLDLLSVDRLRWYWLNTPDIHVPGCLPWWWLL